MIHDNTGQSIPMDLVPLNKIEGALLGAAIGDFLGWPQEIPAKRVDKANVPTRTVYLFQSWKRRTGGRFWNHTEEILPGEYSDDTQLLLATTRSILRGRDWLNHLCKAELPVWLLYERGGGRSVRASSQLWGKGVIPWGEKNSQTDRAKYFMAGGNGVAMRILPHTLLLQQSPQTLFHQIFLNGIATHGHPRALVGGLLYGYAAWLLVHLSSTLKYGELVENLIDNQNVWSRQPESVPDNEAWLRSANKASDGKYNELWNEAIKESVTRLQLILNTIRKGALAVDESIVRELGGFDPNISSAGTVTTPCSIYFVSRYAGDPKAGILGAAFLKGTDTDTLASMIGGLFGILHGTEWFDEEWMSIQDRNYMLALATRISQTTVPSGTNQIDDKFVWSIKSNEKVVTELEAGINSINLITHGQAQVLKSQDLTTGSGISAKSFLLQTQEGQKIYIKKLQRRKDVSPQNNEKGEIPQAKAETTREVKSYKSNFSEEQPKIDKSISRIDAGIYINAFEVSLQTEIADLFVTDRLRFPDLRGLRNSLSGKKLDISVYAWKEYLFGYGMQMKQLDEFGFKPTTICLQDYPRLTERLIIEGYISSLLNAGYTVYWRKGSAEIYQFNHPLLDNPKGIKMFRGFDIRGFTYWDPESEKNIFGIVIDATFCYRDQQGKSLSTSEVVQRFGSGVFRLIRQKQGELTPTGSINVEVSRTEVNSNDPSFCFGKKFFHVAM